MAKFTGRVSSYWYLGFKLMAADSTVRLNLNDLPAGVEPPPEWTIPEDAFKPFLAAVTPLVEYDSRDDDFYPRHGILASASMATFSDKLGSDFNFEVYEFAYNQYFSLGERSVLAVRGYARVAQGDIPFFALSSLGQGSDLRGYTAGRYRDEALFSTQAEYRYELSPRWTVVAFGGVGGVGPSLDAIPQLLPAAGAGVRFSLGKENKLNLRLDAAWGKDDHAIYLSVGEAF
jgi:outer membrane protein assembly factor BamA